MPSKWEAPSQVILRYDDGEWIKGTIMSNIADDNFRMDKARRIAIRWNRYTKLCEYIKWDGEDRIRSAINKYTITAISS